MSSPFRSPLPCVCFLWQFLKVRQCVSVLGMGVSGLAEWCGLKGLQIPVLQRNLFVVNRKATPHLIWFQISADGSYMCVLQKYPGRRVRTSHGCC